MMYRRLGLPVLAVFLAVALIGCRNNRGPQEQDLVLGISFYPETVEVVRGEAHEFAGSVVWSVTGNPSRDLYWDVTGHAGGAVHAGTSISETGALTVALDEPALTLTVTATSGHDPGKVAAATVTLRDPVYTGPPPVTVTLVSPPASVDRGGSAEFTAAVTAGESVNTAVTWSVLGGIGGETGTRIDYDPAASHSATLFVAQGETATSLTVRVESVVNPAGHATAAVTVIHEEPVSYVWLVGHMAENGWDLPGEPMTRENGTFTWQGNVNVPAYFRFNLDVNTENWPGTGIWFAPYGGNAQAALGSNNMERIENPATGGGNAWFITQDGWYVFTVDPAAETLYVERPVVVTGVTIVYPAPQLIANRYYDFEATLAGTNVEGVPVVWEVAGVAEGSGTGFGYGDNAGRLTVALVDAGRTLTVTANAGGHSDSVTLTVANPADIGELVISLTVENRGAGLNIVGGIPPEYGEPVISTRPGETPFVTFAVANPRSDHEYEWIVGGVRNPGPQVTFYAEDFGIGRHSVRLIVTDENGVAWSMPQLLHFVVEQ